MRRGITPVVAIVLLLMMTVAASGGAYAFISSAQQQAQEDASAALSTQVEVRDLRCEDANVEVALKNSGDTALTGSTLDVYLYRDGDLVTSAEKDISSAAVRQPSGLSILSLPFVLDPGTQYTVEVRFPQDDVTVESTCQARLSSLVGHWDFETKIPGQVTDAARSNDGTFENNEKNGTLNNFDFDADSGWVNGKRGSHALKFGLNDKVDTGSHADFDITEELTLAAWVNPDSVSGPHWFIDKRAGSDQQWSMEIRYGRIRVEWYDATGNWRARYTSSSPVSSNEWQHVVFTWDGAQSKFYFDGKSVAASGDPINFESYPNSPVALGFDQGGGGRNFNGTLDEVRMYNRSLSSSEISDLYTGNADPRKDLVGEWSFDEGNGTTAHDTSKWVTGKVGDYALDFDGADDHVVVPHGDSLNFGSGNFTVMLWSKLGAYDPGNLPSFRHYVTKSNGEVYHSSDGPGWGIYWATTGGDQICFGTRDSATSGSSVCNGATPNDGEWHFIAAQKNGSQLALFVDGSWFTSGIARYDDPTTENLEIHGDGRYVKAVSDEIRIYDTALTKRQVSSFYNATK